MCNATVSNITIALLCFYACKNETPLVEDEPTPVVAPSSIDLRGQVVSIRGPIGNVYGGRAFAMETREDDSGSGLDDMTMLVLANAAIKVSDRALTDADDVIVRGKLWEFDRDALHEQLGWNPLNLEEAFDGEPVVVAESVTMAEEPTMFWNEPYQGR